MVHQDSCESSANDHADLASARSFLFVLEKPAVIMLTRLLLMIISQDPTNETRQIAIRIRYLPKGTIAVDKCAAEKFAGIVEKESGTQRNYGIYSFIHSFWRFM